MSLIIFLDIDGVLNNNPWLAKAGFGTLDPSNVQMLARLVQITNADLVISSDWRRYYTYDVLCKRLVKDGVPNRFIGVTPCLKSDGDDQENIVPRGLEIDAWLKASGFNGSFCILDDHSDMQPYQDRLVQTDDDHGLVEVNLKQAVSILINE